MPSPAALSSYNLRHGKLLAHVFLFDEFSSNLGPVKRKRSNDVDLLKGALEECKFEVFIKGSSKSMSDKELRHALKLVAQNKEEVACLMIFILTCEQPSSGGKFLGNFRYANILESIMESNCSKGLKGKPKLIFIQNDTGVILEIMGGDFRQPRRQANEYPVTFDPHVLVGYFERSVDNEPSMASILVQEIQRSKEHTINELLTAIVARKCWDKTPKFTSTLTDNFCIPDTSTPSESKPAQTFGQRNPSIVGDDQSTGLSQDNGSKDNSDDQHQLKRELELYEEAKRHVVMRRKILERMGHCFEQGSRVDKSYEVEDDQDRQGRWGKYFCCDDHYVSQMWVDRRERSIWRDARVVDWGSRPYAMRREHDADRLRSKCAPEDKEDIESEATAETAVEKEKEKKKDQLEPMDDSQPVEEDRNGDMLLALACTAGHISYQSGNGSVFIKSVCTALEKCGDDEDILNVVSVAMNRVAVDIDVSGSKQMPTFTSSLRKQVTLGHESSLIPAPVPA